MKFKTKDLLVTVMPKATLSDDLAKVCLLHTGICINPTLCPNHTLCAAPTHCTGQSVLCGDNCSLRISCFGCSVHFSAGCPGNSCGLGGSACDPTVFCAGSLEPWIIERMEDLTAIRADLKATIVQLDRIEKAGLPSAIQTRAEADALEASLTEALENVRAAKKDLK